MSFIGNLFTLRGWIAARLVLCLIVSPLFMTACGDFAALSQAKSLYDQFKDANASVDSQDTALAGLQRAAFPINAGNAYPQVQTQIPTLNQNLQTPFECPQGTTKLPITTQTVLIDGNTMTDALFKKGASISISLGALPQNVAAVLIKENSPNYSFVKELEARFITTTISTYTSSKLRITRNGTQTSITKTVNFTENYQASAPAGGLIRIPSGANSIYTNTTDIEIDIKDTEFDDIRFAEILVCAQ
ncbi:MAG TPA: hypothetical protein VJB34_04455 [Bdellovibrionota bacterium]|nr:hypothetical protein [Bdellovibrionota bacterium]